MPYIHEKKPHTQWALAEKDDEKINNKIEKSLRHNWWWNECTLLPSIIITFFLGPKFYLPHTLQARFDVNSVSEPKDNFKKTRGRHYMNLK